MAMTRRAVTRFTWDLLTVTVGLVILAALVFPFVWVALTSIRPDAEMFSNTFRLISENTTWTNYQTLLRESDFPIFIRNSLLVCGTATVVAVAIAMLAAYSFSRRQFRFRTALLVLVIATQLFPFVILITPIYTIYARIGVVNSFAGLIFSYIAITLPFSIYLLIGYIDSIPRELDEAAIIDGTSSIGVIFRIIMPVAWPGVVAVAIYAFVNAWDEFLLALTLMTETNRKTVPVGLAGFFGEYTTQWNLVMSASVVATLPTLVLFLLIQRRLVSGLAAGAVKG